MKYLVGNLSAVISVSYILSDKLGLASSLLEPMKCIFDGEPMLLPIPDDAPAEIPRIILTSKDGKFKCNVSKQYVELVYIEDTPAKALQELREQLLKALGDITRVMKNKFSGSIYRLGLVTRLVVFHDTPIELIKEKYIKPGAIDSPRSLELHILNRMDWDTLMVNRWYRILACPRRKTDEGDKEISIVCDINTIPEKKYDFNVESLVAFYDKASRYIMDNVETLI